MKKTIAALLALALLFSLAACSTPTESQQPNATTAPTKPTEPLPEIYNRKSYTGTAEDMIAHRSDVVATFGDAKLTNGLLQMYYWMDVYNFLNSYSSSLSQYGLDINKPLDQQTCTGTAGTWQHYFLAGALEGWAYYQALALAADENNIPLTPDRQKIMDTLQDELRCARAQSLDREPEPGEVLILGESLPRGFLCPALKLMVLTGTELFGKQMSRPRKKKSGLKFSDLTVGDYVVHEAHGVGRFVGVEQLTVENSTTRLNVKPPNSHQHSRENHSPLATELSQYQAL
jgi:predicted small lipoprotein YifL